MFTLTPKLDKFREYDIIMTVLVKYKAQKIGVYHTPDISGV